MKGKSPVILDERSADGFKPLEGEMRTDERGEPVLVTSGSETMAWVIRGLDGNPGGAATLEG